MEDHCNMDISRFCNSVVLTGTLASRPAVSHVSRGEVYYTFSVCTRRLSGTYDTLNVLARASLLAALEPEESEKLEVTGSLRSFNNKSGSGSRLVLSVFAQSLRFVSAPDRNDVELTGVLCKPPVFRTTPLGRDICDLMLALSRRYGRSDYLPCIVWGSVAHEAALWDTGTPVSLTGRLQSREYIKTLDGQKYRRTAFEVSALSAAKVENC